MVEAVPDWPAPLRAVAQVVIAIFAVVFVLVAWVYKTLVAVLRVVGGLASEGGFPSGPTKFPTGNG
jgi:hypothetical protein